MSRKSDFEPLYLCPRCDAYGTLMVNVAVWASLWQDEDGNLQTNIDGFEQFWDDTHSMTCHLCALGGKVADFKNPNYKETA